MKPAVWMSSLFAAAAGGWFAATEPPFKVGEK